MADKGEYLKKIRELKGILRVPRLYEKYKESLNKLLKLDEQQKDVVDGYLHKNGLTEKDLQDVTHEVKKQKIVEKQGSTRNVVL
jgi:hypothetical protein